MKLGRMFIGKHVEPARPVNQVNEQLMHRIAEAKQRLIERNIEPVALLRAPRSERIQGETTAPAGRSHRRGPSLRQRKVLASVS